MNLKTSDCGLVFYFLLKIIKNIFKNYNIYVIIIMIKEKEVFLT